MYLTIYNVETKEELDKCRADEWLEAVQYVEENKQTYLDKGCKRVRIFNKRAKTLCFWDLKEGKRKGILGDKLSGTNLKKK